MTLTLLKKTARCAVIEIDDGGDYYTKESYMLLVNNRKIPATKSITVLTDLKPGTAYVIKAESENGDFLKSLEFETDYESVTLNVKELGAFGDGIHDDSMFIEAAIMACPKDGRVLIPKGEYCVSSIFLKSNLNLEIAKGAVLKFIKERGVHPYYPGEIQTYDEKDERYFGTWEGNPRPMYAGVINGFEVENVCIFGEGTIDGNASFEDWWKNPKKLNTAYRPRCIFLKDCRNVSVMGISVKDSPCWTVHPYWCEDISFYGLSIRNPENSPNTDGINPESCKNVIICGVHFSLGDDCIAVKSGKIYLGKKYKKPSENILVTRCLMENGHGAVTLGSEIAGGVKNLTVKNCIFKNTDRGLRIKTRRGRGSDSVLDGIVFSDIRMDCVKTPFTINSFYFCDPDGKTSYVQTREALPVDERTPVIGSLTFKNIAAENCSVAAMYCEGLPEEKVESITLDHIRISFKEGECKPEVPIMSDGVEPCAKKGLTIRNVNNLVLKDIIVTGCEGEILLMEGINNLDSFL